MRLIGDFHLEKTVEFAVMVTAIIAGLFVAVTPQAAAEPMRVSQQQAEAAVLAKVKPVAPPVALLEHITGTVIVDLHVSEQGVVDSVEVISGKPILSAAAVYAAQRWTFSPFRKEGKPCPAIVRQTFVFGS